MCGTEIGLGAQVDDVQRGTKGGRRVVGTGTRTRVVLRCVLWSLETKPFYAANIVVANAKKM